MAESAVHSIQFVMLLLLCSVVVFGVLAKKMDTPYPIVLMLAGLGLALIPGVTRVPLDPDLIFLVVLPPLLYAAAWQTSWREFSYNISSILLLAFGLVGFTVFGVAYLAPKFLPGFDWSAAFVLGAVVSTTDAIAATSIGRKLGLPQRVMDVLEGESLVNDASGLLALEFGLALLVGGHAPTAGYAVWRLFYLVAGGIGIGLIVAWLIDKLERLVDDGPVEIGISLIVPYGLYLGAEAVHASGVLAVVAAGLYLSRKSTHFFSPQVRIQVMAVWGTLTFLLNGFVFVLMGLQLPYIQQELNGMSVRNAMVEGVLFSLTLIALRLLWMFPGSYMSGWIRRHIQRQKEPMPSRKQVFVVGWTGMRGVVALAAAVSLPTKFADGTPFPQRNTIIFLTFSLIFVTLVLQGLSLPWLIRWLGISEAGNNCEEEEARSIILNAALKRLEAIRRDDDEKFSAVYDNIARQYRARLFHITGKAEGMEHDEFAHFRGVFDELRMAERQTAVRLREERRISDELLHRIENELDLVDARVSLERRER